MAKNYRNIKEYKDSWYALTPNRLIVTLGSLKGEVNCDVCVIGAGFTGLSAALELAQKGLSVTLLEASRVGAGTSGKNSAYMHRGFGQAPGYMIDHFGLTEAKIMANVSLEGLGLILERIAKNDIRCDLKFGHMTAALKPRHLRNLQEDARQWARLGHADLQILGRADTQSMAKARQYIGSMFDPKGAHFHPLNYALGVAHAFQKAGGKIFDLSPVLEITGGAAPRVITEHGIVNAKYIILTSGGRIKGAEKISQPEISAAAHIIATEPLGETRARNMLPRDIAISHYGRFPNYYNFSHDHRLLFGGNISYSNVEYPGEDAALRQQMLQFFPHMKMTLIQHCWSVPLNLTRNQMPHIGRLGPQIYYARGFGSNGVIGTNVIGKVLAEAVAGQASRFDVFARIKHSPYPGGTVMKRPLFVAGMMWNQLRDMLP